MSLSPDIIELSMHVAHMIYEYVDAVERVDRTIEDLQLQVDGVVRVLRSLSEVLNSPEYETLHMVGSESLRENIPQLINSLHTTLTHTARSVDGLRTGGKNNIWKRNWRAMKLLATEGEIKELVSQLKTHSMNLQMAVTTANLMVSVHSPRALASQQTEHFEKLERMLVALAGQMPMPPGAKAPKLADTAYSEKLIIKKDSNTSTLQTCAMKVYSSASTTAGRSLSGQTLVTDNEPAFDFVGGKKATEPTPAYQESTTGSEFGFPLDDKKSSHVEHWIRETSPTESPVETPQSEQPSSKSSTNQTSISSVLASMTSSWNLGGSFQTTEEPSTLYNNADDEDGEDFEIVQRKFKRANDQVRSNNLASAAKLFREAFEIANQLSLKSQEKLDVAGMKITYATSCASMPGFSASDSESALLEVMHTQPTTPTSLEQNLAATHELARLKLEQNELEAAEGYCRHALKERRRARSIGNKHADYYASLKLLVDILSARKDYAAARDHADLLPLEMKGDLDRRLAILQATEESRNPRNHLGPTPPPLPLRPRSPVRYPQPEPYAAR